MVIGHAVEGELGSRAVKHCVHGAWVAVARLADGETGERPGELFRRFHNAYLEMAKGNGKTPLAAGIGLYGMLLDGEKKAEICAAAGYFMSFAGNVTFKNARQLREALAVAPPELVLVETDAPFLAPIPHLRTHACTPHPTPVCR